MLVIARQKATRAGAAARVTFIEADAQDLPVPSDEFQIVCVAFGLRNVADTDRGLAEMTRTCAPGGHVAVLEFSTPTRQPFKALYGWYFRHVLPRIGQFFARNTAGAYEYLPASVGEFPQGEALLERMRAAGLTDTRRYPLTFGVATLYVGTKPRST
jgi:demethylmenaquinone methyltransferase/2-methoxy-6-polyprenyl-1,4-benzoquinol methylase